MRVHEGADRVLGLVRRARVVEEGYASVLEVVQPALRREVGVFAPARPVGSVGSARRRQPLVGDRLRQVDVGPVLVGAVDAGALTAGTCRPRGSSQV